MTKRTLREIANFFDMAVAMDGNGKVLMHAIAPSSPNSGWFPQNGEAFPIPHGLIDYSGDWRDSLTLPENWTKEPPFKEGELIVSIALGLDCISYWHSPACNKELWRRPTEEEWKRLRGEE